MLNLHLGSSDNGELPKSTTARQAYDLITEGFGAGANGPLLVSVTLGSPAKPDQKQLDQVNKKEKQQQQQQPAGAAAHRAVDRRGRAAGPGAVAGAAAGPEAVEPAEEARQGEEAGRVARDRHAADRPRERGREGPRRQGGLPGDGRPGRDRRGVHRDPEDGPAERASDRGSRKAAALGRDPEGHEGHRRERERGRPDRRLHRPGRSHRGQAPADDRDRGRAQLHRPDARVPLDPAAGEGRGGEPALGRRGLRGRHVRLPGGPRRVADRPRRRRCRSRATCRS